MSAILCIVSEVSELIKKEGGATTGFPLDDDTVGPKLSKEDQHVVNTCVGNDGYGRQCRNKRIAWSLYCSQCYAETRPIGM